MPLHFTAVLAFLSSRMADVCLLPFCKEEDEMNFLGCIDTGKAWWSTDNQFCCKCTKLRPNEFYVVLIMKIYSAFSLFVQWYVLEFHVVLV